MESVSLYTEARNEYLKQLSTWIVPPLVEFFRKEYNTIAESNLKQAMNLFQSFCAEVPRWNQDVIDTNTDLILDTCRCDYVEELMTATFIAHTKMLTAIRVSTKHKKLQITLPKLDHFLHRVFIECARAFWKAPFLFASELSPIEKQKNILQAESMCTEALSGAVRSLLPVKNILRDYLEDEGEEKLPKKAEDILEELEGVNDSETVPEHATTPVTPAPAVAPEPVTTPVTPAPAVVSEPVTTPVTPAPVVVPEPATTPVAPAPAVTPEPATTPVAPAPAVTPEPATMPVAPAPVVVPESATTPVTPAPVVVPEPATTPATAEPMFSLVASEPTVATPDPIIIEKLASHPSAPLPPTESPHSATGPVKKPSVNIEKSENPAHLAIETEPAVHFTPYDTVYHASSDSEIVYAPKVSVEDLPPSRWGMDDDIPRLTIQKSSTALTGIEIEDLEPASTNANMSDDIDAPLTSTDDFEELS